MITSVDFSRFKALRNARLALRAFNLVIGPNGSGKTSLIQALLRLRTLAALSAANGAAPAGRARPDGPEIAFRFDPPGDGITVRLRCVNDLRCDALEVSPANAAGWPALRQRIRKMRAYQLDHLAMIAPAAPQDNLDLAANGANLAAVLAALRRLHPERFAQLEAELRRLMPEFSGIRFSADGAKQTALSLSLTGDGTAVAADDLSQGTLYLLALLALVYQPEPPPVVCIEEADRGIHPRMLRDVRDLLYRLSHPRSCGEDREPAQVIATTHSPYFLDLFQEHPEDVVLADKHGREATFARLTDRNDWRELLAESSLGDIWFSGILGGVPEEK